MHTLINKFFWMFKKMEKEVEQKIGDFWSEQSVNDSPTKIRWWEFPIIL